MSTCGKVGSYVHALIKELAIRWIEHKLEIYSNESQHLSEGTEVARLQRRFSFVLKQALIPHASSSLQTGGGACEHPTAMFAKGPVSVHAHRTEGVTESEGREGANGDGGRIGVGGGNGDGNGVGGGNGDVIGHGGTGTERERERGWRRTKERRMGTETGAKTGREQGRERGRGRGWRSVDEHRMGTGTGAGAGTGWERGRGRRPVDEHRMGTGTGAGTGWGRGRGRGWRPVDEHRMGTGTGAGTGRERGRGRGWRPVDEHRKGTGTKMRTVAEMGTGTRRGEGEAKKREETLKSC